MYQEIEDHYRYESNLVQAFNRPTTQFIKRVSEDVTKGPPREQQELPSDIKRNIIYKNALMISNRAHLHYAVLYRAMYFYDLFLKEVKVFDFSWYDMLKEMTERQYGGESLSDFQLLVSFGMVLLKTAHVLESPDDSSSIGIYTAGRDILFEKPETDRTTKFMKAIESSNIVGKALINIESFFLETIKFSLQTPPLAFHYISSVTKFLDHGATSYVGRRLVRHLDLFFAVKSTFSYNQEEIAEAFISMELDSCPLWIKNAEITEFIKFAKKGNTEKIQSEYREGKKGITWIKDELDKRFPDYQFRSYLQKLYTEGIYEPPTFFS